jgi:hypothetical protein
MFRRLKFSMEYWNLYILRTGVIIKDTQQELTLGISSFC